MSKIVNKIDVDKYDTFLFDLYGTLIDIHTDEHCSATWKKWMKWLNENRINHPWHPVFRRSFFKMDRQYRIDALNNPNITCPEIDVTDIYRVLFTKYGNNLDDNTIREASYAFRGSSIDYIKLFPGVEDYLRYLHSIGKKVYILSNAQASYTEPEIINLGLDKLVDGYYMSSDYGCMKPDTGFFNVAIKNENIDTSRAIMIGDNSDSDIAGAINAGMDAYQIHDGDLFTPQS